MKWKIGDRVRVKNSDELIGIVRTVVSFTPRGSVVTENEYGGKLCESVFPEDSLEAEYPKPVFVAIGETIPPFEITKDLWVREQVTKITSIIEERRNKIREIQKDCLHRYRQKIGSGIDSITVKCLVCDFHYTDYGGGLVRPEFKRSKTKEEAGPRIYSTNIPAESMQGKSVVVVPDPTPIPIVVPSDLVVSDVAGMDSVKHLSIPETPKKENPFIKNQS